MGNHDLHGGNGGGECELCGSNHFYAAYIFDQADSHRADIAALCEEAGRLDYPVRYWWLSQAMDIQNSHDRLIVCVHHPRNDENAGMDLYDALKARQVSYDELDAAVVEEYLFLGRRVANIENISQPDGLPFVVQAQTSLTVLLGLIAVFFY